MTEGILPYQQHSVPSLEASLSKKVDAATESARVLAYLEGAGPVGATDEEIQRALQMNPSTQRPRRIELMHGGRVIDSGKVRKTSSGRNATVWKVREDAL